MGLLWIDGCTPNCAQGRFSSRRVSITASRIRDGRYTRLLLIYRLNGRETDDRRKLKRLSGTDTPTYQWS
jgi:hypothetical protein